ncbi:juvenile hormone esterase-like [Diprion similis]|uniref:juvenile hormone esterase-like n=1 Tax=Diprion similis TaxID=362088 RepID=UPI001EF7BD60|nr:juvenile hormone esterase-like [Diprion similis]
MGPPRVFYFCLVTLFLNLLIHFRTGCNAATASEVTIPQGSLQGAILFSRQNRSIFAFYGIPYGQPPVGDLRFSSPVAANAWNGTLNATVEGNVCIQYLNGAVIGDEDCLYLNVYTPQLPNNTSSSLLPVMVWIPGGGFEQGSGNSDLYSSEFLLDSDVLLVSVSYRLGALGFLSTGDDVAPGNWGLKDQVLALKWVQNNIAYFGGDPDQITLFGQSAGGASVQLHALSDLTTGLFHKYISQSGSALGFWPWRPSSTYANRASLLGEYVGCPTNGSTYLVACLRQINASVITQTITQLYVWGSNPFPFWGPTDEPDVDGAFLIDNPETLIKAGKMRDLPAITGSVRNEGVGFLVSSLPGSDLLETLLDDFDNLAPIIYQYSGRVDDESTITAALKSYYFNNDMTTNRTLLWYNLTLLVTDIFFMYPIYTAVQEQYAIAENSPYFYSFEYRGTYSYGSQYIYSSLLDESISHCDELLYLFPETDTLFGVGTESMTETDLLMVETMVQLWTSFAINGTPTTSAAISNTTWLPYSASGNYLRIGNDGDPTLEIQYDFLPERMLFWKELMTSTTSGNTSHGPFSLGSIAILLIVYSKVFL